MTHAPKTVKVRMLRGDSIRVGDKELSQKAEAQFALAFYLSTRAGERVGREDLLELFWPDGSESDRRHAMRQMIYRLRRLGIALTESGDHIVLQRDLVDSDVHRVLQPTWPETATESEVESALGSFVSFSNRLPSEFLRWFDELRSTIEGRARRAAIRLMTQARNEGRWPSVEYWGRFILRVDELNEEATLASAEAAAMSGSKGQALEILDAYIAELGPTARERVKLAQSMRRRIAERRGNWVPRSSPEVSLVGREHAMSHISRTLDSDDNLQSRSVLLLGSSGFGKSRLLHEARECASLRGYKTLEVRVDPTETAHPWSLARQLIRLLVEQPGAVAVSPHVMATVRSLVRPEQEAGGPMSAPPELTPTSILGCLVPLLIAIAEENRTLLTIDDLQYSDAYSLSLVASAMAELRTYRCAIIAAAHPGVAAQLALHETRAGIDIVRLPALSTEESRTLAKATASAHGYTLSDSELSAIAESSGGHPIFARELALARARGTSTGPLPSSLGTVVAGTLSHQSQSSLRLLRIAALLGDAASTSRVQKASGLPPHEFLSCVESLSNDAIVHLDGNRMLRIHDSWREEIFSSMPEVIAAALALECASVLESDAASDEPIANRRVAALYRTAGENSKATQLDILAVDSLLSSGLYSAALDALSGLRSRVTDARLSARLRARESFALLGCGRFDAAAALADGVWRSRELRTAGMLSDHLLAVAVSADCQIKLFKSDDGVVDELIHLSRSDRLPAADRARACLAGTRLTINTVEAHHFRQFADANDRLAREIPNSAIVALTRLIGAAELRSAADVLSAHSQLDQIDYDALSAGDRCLVLRCSAHALRIAGRMNEAIRTAEAAITLADKHLMPVAAATASELAGSMYLDQLDLSTARRWLDAASNGPRTTNIRSARDFTRDRLHFAEGRLDELATSVDEKIETARSFGASRGRCTELSLAAAVLASVGRRADADALVAEVLGVVKPLCGRYAADLTIDFCLRAAANSNLEDEAVSVAKDHLNMRHAVGAGPLALSCTALRGVEATLV